VAYGQGFAGGYADTLVPPAPVEEPGGEYGPLHKPKPRRRQPEFLHREGRAALVLFVEMSTSGAGTATARLDLQAGGRAFDPLLQEREDRIFLAAGLIETGQPFRMALNLGQEDAAWDRYRAEEEERLRRRLLGPVGPEKHPRRP
jgi:hypothetical protein